MTHNNRHAVYAITDNVKYGEHIAFRIGQPVNWNSAVSRYDRLYCRHQGINCPSRPVKVKHDGRVYRVQTFDVRAVDRHGRGLDSERHATAIVAPYRAVRSAER